MTWVSGAGTGSLPGGGGRGWSARSRLLKIRTASASRVRSSRSPKACGSDENSSNNPISSVPRRSGITITERTPSRCQTSWPTRESAKTSSHRCVWRIRMHSREIPDAASIREPNAGAVAPLLARQTISPSRSSAIAAPVAPVVRQACSTTSLSTISRAKSVESSGDRPLPLCEKHAASFAKSVLNRTSSGRARSTPVALRLGFDGSGPDVAGCAITEAQLRESSSVAEFRPKTAGCQYGRLVNTPWGRLCMPPVSKSLVPNRQPKCMCTIAVALFHHF